MALHGVSISGSRSQVAWPRNIGSRVLGLRIWFYMCEKLSEWKPFWKHLQPHDVLNPEPYQNLRLKTLEDPQTPKTLHPEP